MGIVATVDNGYYGVDDRELSGSSSKDFHRAQKVLHDDEFPRPNFVYPLDISRSGANQITFQLSKSGSDIVQEFDFGPSNKIPYIVRLILDTFSLSSSELSKVVKVDSRKTPYNWVNGVSKPQAKTMARLFDLMIIAEGWQQLELPTDDLSLTKAVLQGKSIKDLLAEDKLDKDAIFFAGKRLLLDTMGGHRQPELI